LPPMPVKLTAGTATEAPIGSAWNLHQQPAAAAVRVSCQVIDRLTVFPVRDR
jgi:hypothetical protein